MIDSAEKKVAVDCGPDPGAMTLDAYVHEEFSTSIANASPEEVADYQQSQAQDAARWQSCAAKARKSWADYEGQEQRIAEEQARANRWRTDPAYRARRHKERQRELERTQELDPTTGTKRCRLTVAMEIRSRKVKCSAANSAMGSVYRKQSDQGRWPKTATVSGQKFKLGQLVTTDVDVTGAYTRSKKKTTLTVPR